MLEGCWRLLRPGGVFFCRLASSIGIERFKPKRPLATHNENGPRAGVSRRGFPNAGRGFPNAGRGFRPPPPSLSFSRPYETYRLSRRVRQPHVKRPVAFALCDLDEEGVHSRATLRRHLILIGHEAPQTSETPHGLAVEPALERIVAADLQHKVAVSVEHELRVEVSRNIVDRAQEPARRRVCSPSCRLPASPVRRQTEHSDCSSFSSSATAGTRSSWTGPPRSFGSTPGRRARPGCKGRSSLCGNPAWRRAHARTLR